MQNHSPLQVILSDMHRAGVTDVVGETAFNFSKDKIKPPFAEVLSVQIPASIKPQKTAKTAKTVEATITAITPKKNAMATIEVSKTVKARPVDALLWSFGKKNAAVQIILSSSLDKGIHPLSEKAQALFVKMLASININESEVLYRVLSSADKFSKTEKKTALTELSNQSEGTKSIFIGEEATQLIFDAGILKTRQKENTFTGKACGILMHPESLLAQPLLKKIAWQDLLKFESTMRCK